MERYPDRVVNEWFLATVEACKTTVTSDSVVPFTFQTGWGDETMAIGLNYEISSFY